MSNKSLRIACLLVALGWSATAHAQAWYSISTNPADSGGQAQIGGGLPLPIQLATNTMTGGKLSNGTTMTPMGGTAPGPIGTGMNVPPLLIPVNKARAAVKQTAGADPKALTVPVGAFRRAPTKSILGVAANNPTVYQVRTNIEFSGPAPAWGSAMFKAGGRTGAKTTIFYGIPGTVLNPSIARYSGSAARFGGPSRTKVVPATQIKVWAHGPNPGAQPPCHHPAFGTAGSSSDCLGLIVYAHPGTLAVAGAAVASPPDMTKGGVVMTSGVVAVSVNAKGTVLKSAFAAMTAPIANTATSSGFPWTTGKLTLSQPDAAGTPEVFTITGKDTRMAGVGTITLVAGSLSDRTTSGPNSNRSWSQYKILPEPGAVLGAAAALAALGVCHGLVRRRSR